MSVGFHAIKYTITYRLGNLEGLILLDSWNAVLHTRYKRRASHYSSQHLKTIIILVVLHERKIYRKQYRIYSR